MQQRSPLAPLLFIITHLLAQATNQNVMATPFLRLEKDTLIYVQRYILMLSVHLINFYSYFLFSL